jgi:dynein light intermediate chain 1, cytosolic
MAEAATAGIVGPLGSSSFSLPTVERALSEMEAGIGGSVAGSADARRRAAGRPPSSTLSTSLGVSTAAAGAGRTAASPALGSAGPSSASGQTQHEVLQNFFQSLLSSKDRQGSGSARSPPPKTNGTGTAGSGGGTEESG